MVETELHRALLREDWARSQQLLLEQPALAREADPVRGGRPLHVAAICGAPLSLVRRLVEADPSGLAARDCWERTPLDAAMRNQKASAAVLAYLQADPMPFVALAEARDWAQLVAKQRQQPAGAWVAALAEERGAPGRIVTELCELLGPESLAELVEARLWGPLAARSTHLITAEVCAVHDADGRYPVEVAIQGGAPDELVQQLTSHSPQPILVHAIAAGDWARAIALASVKPDWASVKDHRRGWLPLHTAVRGGAPLALVRQLVEAFPEGLAAKDSNDRTAYEIAVQQAQRNSESQALPLSPTREPKAGRPSWNHSAVDPALQQKQVQQAEVIDFIQHYPALRDAAERHDWGPVVATQRETSSGSAWIASLAGMHGAPPSVMDSLSECLGLHATISAEAWSTLLRHSDQLITTTSCATPSPVPAHSEKTGDANTSEQPQQEYATIIRTLHAVKLHLWVNLLIFAVALSVDFGFRYPLQQALHLRTAPAEVLRLLRDASDGCDSALQAALKTAMATHQWSQIASLELLTASAGAAMAKEVMELKQALAEERSSRLAVELQREAALSREGALLTREKKLHAELAKLRQELDTRG